MDMYEFLNGKKKKKVKDPLASLMVLPNTIIGDRITKKQRKAIKKNPFGDWDGDHVINGLDCQPRNKKKHMAISFGRKPKNMDRNMWERYKETQNKITHKNNTHIDPRLKMNTILTNNKYMRQHKKVNPVFRDEDWQRDYNEDAISALKEQGYSEDDALGFLAEKNKRKMEVANYFAQELARDEQVGNLFKGAIPEVPISDEEGLRRYGELQKYENSIKLGSIQKIKPKRTEEDEMYDFMREQEDEGYNHFKKLKNKPKKDWTNDDKEFYDAEKDYYE